MKKVAVLLLLISLLSFRYKVASFQYTLVSMSLQGQFVDNKNGTGTQDIVIISGISGEIYGFNKADVITVLLKTSQTFEANKIILNQAAIDFVKKKYPNL